MLNLTGGARRFYAVLWSTQVLFILLGSFAHAHRQVSIIVRKYINVK